MANGTMTTQAEQGIATKESTRESERFVTPAVDIYETKEGLHVVAEIPGALPDQIKVSVDNDVLTIEARVSEVTRQYDAMEFQLAGYYRQFTLGNKIDQSKIKADFKHGVLNVALPFAEAARPRQIQVCAT